jgi:hypothetical protein
MSAVRLLEKTTSPSAVRARPTTRSSVSVLSKIFVAASIAPVAALQCIRQTPLEAAVPSAT